MTTRKRIREKKYELEFYTLNVTVLPIQEDYCQFYIDTFTKIYEKDIKVEIGKDFYYQLIKLDKIEEKDQVYFYGVFAKFLKLDNINWVRTEDVKQIKSKDDFVLPKGLEGRKGLYEFVFEPSNHKLAFVKKGRINDEIEKKGAPLMSIVNVLKIGIEQVITQGLEVHIDVVTDTAIIDRIFNTKLTHIEFKLHYSNPGIDDDHGQFMDDLFRDSESTKISMKLDSHKGDYLNPDSKLVKGTVELSRTNGTVKAKGKNDKGQMEEINTAEHPEVTIVEVISKERKNEFKFLQQIRQRLLEITNNSHGKTE